MQNRMGSRHVGRWIDEHGCPHCVGHGRAESQRCSRLGRQGAIRSALEISFPSAEELLKVLGGRRLDLLRKMAGAGPLATEAERHVYLVGQVRACAMIARVCFKKRTLVVASDASFHVKAGWPIALSFRQAIGILLYRQATYRAKILTLGVYPIAATLSLW